MERTGAASKKLYRYVGTRIRDTRTAAGLTQMELASRVSLSRTSIANIERGRQKIQLHTLLRTAAALSVPVLSFLPDLTSVRGQDPANNLPKDLTEGDRAWIEAIIAVEKTEERNGGQA